MSPMVDGESWWMTSAQATPSPALAGAVSADVCVVGGGMTGLVIAWELHERGHSVVVLEAGRLAARITGYTTSKLTAQHGLRLQNLERQHGSAAAAWYAQANERAIHRIADLARDQQIDCDMEMRDAYVYAAAPPAEADVQAEVEAAQRAGLDATWVDAPPLPYQTAGAMRLPSQYQFHPRRFLLGLAERLAARGVQIFEGSRATAVDGDGPFRVEVGELGHVDATAVVVATVIPSPVGSELLDRMYGHQGFAIAAEVDGDPLGGGIYINADRPMRSLRTIPRSDGAAPLLQVGGSAWVDEPVSGAQPWDDLAAFAREAFATGDPVCQWSTQDYSSTDSMPFVGRLRPDRDVYVATGFGGWGLSMAGVSAELTGELVDGGTPDGAAFAAPTRSAPSRTTAIVSGHRSGLPVDPEDALDALEPGAALVLEMDGEEIAAYRSEDGTLLRRSAVCTHHGCIVLWDADDSSWICPCHASRFAPDGSVIDGPAKDPLPER